MVAPGPSETLKAGSRLNRIDGCEAPAVRRAQRPNRCVGDPIICAPAHRRLAVSYRHGWPTAPNESRSSEPSVASSAMNMPRLPFVNDRVGAPGISPGFGASAIHAPGDFAAPAGVFQPAYRFAKSKADAYSMFDCASAMSLPNSAMYDVPRSRFMSTFQ